MDQELISYFDERFHENSRQTETLHQETTRQIAALREETNQRFERIEGAVHHTQITVEAMRGDIQLLAEGAIGQGEMLQASRGEVNFRLDEIKGLIGSFGPRHSDLDRRVHQLEEHVARENQNPIDIIRERFGKAK